MTIEENAETFGGKAVKDYDPDSGLGDADNFAYRIQIDWERHENGESATDVLASLLADPAASRVSALVFGDWGGTAEGESAEDIVETLVGGAERLPELRALFLGDMTYEQCEISWIIQTDVSPLYGAFPKLEELRIRGGGSLSLGRLKHDRLRRLVIETGGLDREVVHQVAGAELPALEHLELWLGTDEYGWNGSIDDVRPLLDGSRFPKLTYLGLRDSMIADEIAQAVASAPILAQLRVLDLSLGIMGDDGAAALAAAPGVRSLEKLDVHHNYITPVGVAKLGALGITVVADDQQSEDEYGRFVAVSE